MKFNKPKIAVIGLGYVGLPLAIEFSKKYDLIGFDIDSERIDDLKKGFDKTNEVNQSVLKNLKNLVFSSDILVLNDVNIFIVTVPTPVDKNNNPDLTPLKSATEIVAKNLRKNDINSKSKNKNTNA